MRRMALLVCALTVGLVLTIMAGPLSQRGFSPKPAQARLPALSMSVACKATPEKTHIKNNRNRAITTKTVGSIHRPYSYEPFRVDRRLGGGNSITFESGSGANNHVLTKSYIYKQRRGKQGGC